MPRHTRIAAILLMVVATCAGAGGAPLPRFLRGVTVSCQTWGIEWQTPEMASTLDELRSLGANSFAIHPYARISDDGQVRFRATGDNRHITAPLDWAHERGMAAMVIPHIAYWGSKFSWRGEIRFDTDEQWDRFFSGYETWIVEMARIAEAHHAPLFCVGLEYTHAQKFTERWLQIIAAVRSVYFGKLTYGANWNEYREVQFWDALDYVGLLAYFPLTTASNPSPEQIAEGWGKRCRELERFSRRNGDKQIVFVEVGYNENARAAAEPWSFDSGGDHAREIQERCIEAALALSPESGGEHARHPWLAGMFFWKWFPDLPMHEEEDFRLQTPTIKALLAKHWKP